MRMLSELPTALGKPLVGRTSLRRNFSLLLILLIVSNGRFTVAAELPTLGVTAEEITVSGVSSGGYMAVQYHIAHSAQVFGAGILAAGPYECAKDDEWFIYPQHCMQPDESNPIPDTDVSVWHVQKNAAAGLIDSPDNLKNDRVWLFSGGKDEKVTRVVVDALEKFYRTWTSNIEYRKVENAGHAMISGDDVDVNECDTSKSPFINHCDGEDAPGMLLRYLLRVDELVPKAAEGVGELVDFDQSEFNKVAGAHGLGDVGYVFIPTACRSGGCRLHVAFHGCKQSVDNIQTKFVTDAGYNRWAESNRIVVLYPQATFHRWFAFKESFPGFEVMVNPFGCWDWWGYEDDDYATRNGAQIKAVNLMVSRLIEKGQ